MLANRFGQFIEGGRAFRITDPNTPMPWVNVICNGRYGLVVSQNGGGFSWYDDAQHNVLTRWEMDLVRDCYGKFLYISEPGTGKVWSAAPAPCRAAMQQYDCTHTLGSTTFRTSTDGIATEWTLTVAPADGAELWLVKITNTSAKPRTLRVSSYFEWTCGVAPDVKREFHRLFFNTKYDAGRRAMIATKNMWDIPRKSEREHWNVPWPYVAAHAVCGVNFDSPLAMGDKSAFLGRYGTTGAPAAMTAAAPAVLPASFGRFGDSVAALGGDLVLAPGQSVTMHYVLAIAADEPGVLALLDKYRDAPVAAGTLAAAHDAWSHRLSTTSITTDRDDFNVLNNHWLPYQAISGRMWGRTGYYQQSGAFGFRDQLQDSQVWLPIDPAGCLRQLMLHAEKQFADGTVYHWWHALADFGNHTACSDDYLWLPFVASAYLRETGDYSALRRTARWVDDATPATLLEHCKRSFARSFARFSERGLPHIGSCDWNDGLSAMGVGEKGESVWLAQFLVGLLGDWRIILERLGDQAGAADFAARREKLIAAINTHAWDGQWYRYGTKDNGEWVGASASPEGKVHLNAQTWSILADVAPAERASAAWQTVKQNLLSPYGPLLLAPAYTVPDTTIGYITRYSPGSRENGGVYMHAATWALAAACKMRDIEAVGRIWKSIAPASRGQDAESYWAEPYVTPGNVDGPLSDKPGRAGWTWYTGSAAWLNRVCLEWVLGIRPTFGGLLIDPCPPADLGHVSVVRTWRGRQIKVSFNAAEFVPGGRPFLTVDGVPLEGNTLPESVLAGHAVRAVVGANGHGNGHPDASGSPGGAAGLGQPINVQVINIQVSWGPRPKLAAVATSQVKGHSVGHH